MKCFEIVGKRMKLVAKDERVSDLAFVYLVELNVDSS